MTEFMQPKPTHERLCILVVEDSDVLREMFLHAFSSMHIVYAADKIEDGWKLYIDKNPDIVFLDISLPDGNGHDLALRIKKRNPNTYVVMATASRYTEDKQEAASNHVDGFLTKPFTKKEINEHVSWYMTNYRQVAGVR
jgi:DNA-binding response OmpR family regulator